MQYPTISFASAQYGQALNSLYEMAMAPCSEPKVSMLVLVLAWSWAVAWKLSRGVSVLIVAVLELFRWLDQWEQRDCKYR